MEKYFWNEDKFFKYWSKGQKEINGFSPLLTIGALEYYMEYFKDRDFIKNLCYVAVENNEVVGLVPVLIFSDEKGKKVIQAGAMEFLKGPFVVNNITHKLRKRFYEDYLNFISHAFFKYQIDHMKAIVEPCHLMAGVLYQHPLQNYANSFSIINCNIVDLRDGINKTWNNIRNSYRSLINKAKKNYKQTIIDENNFNKNDCEKYRFLHAEASGRAVRPISTFEKMYSMIKRGEAFLVLIEENKKELGAYLFFISGTAAYYASSATKPNILNSMGIGHLGVWLGIEHSLKNGIQFMDMSLYEDNSDSDIDEKVKAINFFKKGYGGLEISLIGMNISAIEN